MKTKNPRSLRIFGWSDVVAAVLQTIGLIRYINRSPDDWIGITLYTITLLAFIAVSAGAFIQARKLGS